MRNIEIRRHRDMYNTGLCFVPGCCQILFYFVACLLLFEMEITIIIIMRTVDDRLKSFFKFKSEQKQTMLFGFALVVQY